MHSLRNSISNLEPLTLAQCILKYKEISHSLSSFPTDIRIASVCSFTLKWFNSAVSFFSAQNGIKVESFSTDYNTYLNEITTPDSSLFSFRPDLVFLWIDTQSLLGNAYLNPLLKSTDEWNKWTDETCSLLCAYINLIEKNSDSIIVIHSLEQPVFSPFGILENKQENGIQRSVSKINDVLIKTAKEKKRLLVFNTDAFFFKYGRNNLFNPKWYYLADMRISPDAILPLCKEYLSFIIPVASKNKKAIILDLDNTLWGGIIGEDGLEGINLGPTPEGRSFYEFQQILLSLHKRGVILAINSKNNPEDALNVIHNHPYMLLREEHFSAMRINWNNKAQNIKEIAIELNINTDSMVFFDDEPSNREMVKNLLPDVFVPELPSDPVFYPSILQNMPCFNTLSITSEDFVKGELYFKEKQRKQLETIAFSHEDFVRALGMKVKISLNKKSDIPRISQLTMKTNQFNMTTRRYTEADIEKFFAEGYSIYSIKAEDKFGDYGIIGTVIINNSNNSAYIDTFLLSCRIIGRSVEYAVFSSIAYDAVQKGIKTITAEFIPSAKNLPAKEFYASVNGKKINTDKGSMWMWSSDDLPQQIDIITIIRED